MAPWVLGCLLGSVLSWRIRYGPPVAIQEQFQIVVPHQGVEHVTARLDVPDPKATGSPPTAVFVMAHGAGAGMASDFMEAVAPRIADAAGIAVLRFNYGYAEKMQRSGSRFPPEKRQALDVVHREIFAKARERFAGMPLIGGGKSMGGRMSSLMAAEGEPLDGLCFLGYPLHPPGKPEKLRTDHFPELKLPMLFVQGTRDALCGLDLLETALKTLSQPATLHVVEGGDHSFSVLKRSGRTPDEVLDEIAAAVAAWVPSVKVRG